MIFNSGISSISTGSNATCQELSLKNIKKLKKREITEILVSLNSTNAKINRLAPPPKAGKQNVLDLSKDIKKKSNDSKSHRSHQSKSNKSFTSRISSYASNAMRKSGFVPKNVPSMEDKEEWLLFLAIKGINFIREMYLHFGVDLSNIDETIKVEPQAFLLKMLQFLKPFINSVQYETRIEGFFNDPEDNFNPKSYFGINHQIEQIKKLLDNISTSETIIREKIKTCLRNFEVFLKEFFNLINKDNLPQKKKLLQRWSKIDASFQKAKKKKENFGEKIEGFYDEFRLLLLDWKDNFMEIMNVKLADLIPKCQNYQMRGDLKDFFETFSNYSNSFRSSCKEINWEIVDYYVQYLTNQISTNERNSPKNMNSDIIESLKMLNVLLANIEFSCEIMKNDNTTEVVQIKFPVYDKKYDLYTSKEGSSLSESTNKFDSQNTVLKIKNSIVISEQNQNSLGEIVELMKDIDNEINKKESSHSENNLMLFLYDNYDSLAEKFKEEFENKLRNYPSKDLMLIKSIVLEIYSFRIPCVKCSSLLLGKNNFLFSSFIKSVMKIFPENLIAKNKKLYSNENENLIELKKKLVFTRFGDGKDLFRQYDNQNLESCLWVDSDNPKSYTGEKLFPKSIKIKNKENLEKFLRIPHTFFINDRENTKEPEFMDSLKKFCFRKNNPDSEMGIGMN